MIWVLISALGLTAWLSIVLFFVALCHEAGRPDQLANAPGVRAPANVIDLRAFRQLREHRAGDTAPRASALG